MSKVSIPYWLKKNNGWGGPYEKIVEAVLYYAQHRDHPDIAFEGSTLALATELYTTHAHKAGAAGGLYCTRPDVAEKMARSFKLRPSQVVLIPGLGLGALAEAALAVQPEALLVGVECQDWLVRVAQAARLPVTPGDFLNGVSLPAVGAVLVNPPYGNLWGSKQIERDFMARVAAVTQPGVKIAALLPGEPGFFFDKLPNAFAPLRTLFEIEEAEYYPEGAALPRSIPCTRYLLTRV